MKIFPGEVKVSEFGLSQGNWKKKPDKSQGKVREIQNFLKTGMSKAVIFRNIYFQNWPHSFK